MALLKHTGLAAVDVSIDDFYLCAQVLSQARLEHRLQGI